MNQQDDSEIEQGYRELSKDPDRLVRRAYQSLSESEDNMLGKNQETNAVEDRTVESSLYSKKIPTRSSVLFFISLTFLVLTALFQRMVFMAPANPDKNFLFAYQMMATTFSWVFVITGAGALYTLLAYLTAKETFNSKNK